MCINKLAFGQTRFAAASDPIEHISEEKFLLQIFAKMEGGPYYNPQQLSFGRFRGPRGQCNGANAIIYPFCHMTMKTKLIISRPRHNPLTIVWVKFS